MADHDQEPVDWEKLLAGEGLTPEAGQHPDVVIAGDERSVRGLGALSSVHADVEIADLEEDAQAAEAFDEGIGSKL